MVTLIKLYIEGGRSQSKDIEMRRGFSAFFRDLKKIGDERGISLRCITFQGRQHAYEKFCFGLRQEPEAFHVLLVDSEAPVKQSGAGWQHVKEREGDGWERPETATEENLHFMAQAVEAWFFADPEALAAFYGQKFNASALPKTQNVEQIPKSSHITRLEAATKPTQKGRYDKTDHAPKLLERIDSHRVRARAPHCERLFHVLASEMGATV